MSTLKDSTLVAPAVPDTTLGSDPGQYRKPEIAIPDPAAEFTPPAEDDLRAFARQEFEGNEVFEERRAAGDEQRAARAKRHHTLKKMLMTVTGVAVTGAVVLGSGIVAPDLSPTPTPAPEPTPTPEIVEELSTIRQILSMHPNWYSAEFDVYLHFNEGVAWLYDHGDFHRILWTIEGEGTDDERLVIETGYCYLVEDGTFESNEFTAELQIEASKDSFALDGVVGINFHDDASTTFVPVDAIGVDSTYADRFGAMTGQEILEAIGTFVIHDARNEGDVIRYTGLSFANGAITIMSAWADPVTARVDYLERLSGHIYSDEVVIEDKRGGDPFEPGRLPGIMVIRQDNIYFYFISLTPGIHSLEFIAGSIPEGEEPEPVEPSEPESGVAVGDIITLGSYEQDGDSRNGPEPIEWRVLAVEGKRALVISVYGLDCMPLSARGDGNAWATSGLKAWLNGEFRQTSFTPEERRRIAEITCLSTEEAERYFVDDADRQCLPTAYALDRGVWTYEGNCEWWLRSPGTRGALDRTAYVAPDGSIFREGIRVYSDTFAVRPAMWVKL